MRRLWIFILFILLCSGCAPFGADSYVVVEPHDEGYEVAIDSNAVTVSSYLGLKNAITDMVEEGVTDGVIRAEGYSGDVTEDIASAVYEVWRGDPLGDFAVDYMTYDCSKIVNYYEIHVHTTYRRTAEEIESIQYVSDLDELTERVRDTMSEYGDILRVRLNDDIGIDFEELVFDVFQDNPDFALELPKVAVNSYPESGSQRILEIVFTYETPQETLLEMHQEVSEILETIIKLYGSANDDTISARRYYNRVIRDGVLLNSQDAKSVMPDSIYGVLVEKAASSFGYAQAYGLMLRSKEIPCVLLNANYLGQKHYLCLITLEDIDYYVDPARGVMEKDSEMFLMTEEDLWRYGYEILE